MEPVVWAAMVGALGVLLGTGLTLLGAHLADRRAVARERERLAAERTREADARLFDHRREAVLKMLELVEGYTSSRAIEELDKWGDPPEDALEPAWRALALIALYFPDEVSERARALYQALSDLYFGSTKDMPAGGYVRPVGDRRDEFLAAARVVLGVKI